MAVVILAGLVAVLLAVVVWSLVAWRWLVRRRVVVVLEGERSVAGMLWARRGALLVLRQASITQGGKELPLDGDVVVERGRVQWIQVLR